MTQLLPIPPIETAEDPAFTPADVGQRWRALIGELGFAEPIFRANDEVLVEVTPTSAG